MLELELLADATALEPRLDGIICLNDQGFWIESYVGGARFQSTTGWVDTYLFTL